VSVRRIIAALLAVTCCAVAAAAIEPAGAEAGSYTIGVCDGPDKTGANAVFEPEWYGRFGHVYTDCAPGRGIYTDIVPWGQATSPYEGAGLAFCAPSGTRLTAFKATAETSWAGVGYDRRVDGRACGNFAVFAGGQLPPSLGGSDLQTFSASGLSTGGLGLITVCSVFPSCGGLSAATEWSAIRITIDDYTAASISNRSGLWGQGGWVRGSWPVGFSASDSTGIRTMMARVDEEAVGGAGRWQAQDDWPCQPDGNITRAAPCDHGTRSFSRTLDTTTLGNGRHDLSLHARDGGRNWGWSGYSYFNVDNTAPTATLSRAAGSYSRTVTWNVSDPHSGVNGGSLAATYSTGDGATWQSMSGSWNATAGTYTATVPANVADGPLQVRLSGRDNANPGGNSFTSAASPVTVDGTAPAAPVDLVVTPSGWSATNSFEARWTNPGGQVAPITKANWKLCPAGQTTGCQTGSATGEGIAALPTVTAPSAGSWELTVQLEDQAGNTSSANAAGPVTLRHDAVKPRKPTISVPGRWLNRDDPTYHDATLATPEAPASGIGGYSVTRDGSDPDASIDRTGTTAVWRIDDLADGTTTIKARTISGAGLVGDPAQAVIRMDRELPTTTLLGAGNPATPHPGPVTVTLGARDGVSGMGAAPDGEPVTGGAYVAYKLDGAAGFTRVAGDEARIPVAGDGAHVLEYFAVDAAGNKSATEARSMTIAAGVPGNRVPDPGLWDRAVNPATTFTAAKRFGAPCPAQATLTADRDATLHEPDPDAKAGGHGMLAVGPAKWRRETVIGFPLPGAPDCTVESATLRVHAASFGHQDRAAGRPIEVRRASSAWTEAAVTWNTRPGTVGPGVTTNAPSPAAPDWMEWNVTAQVQALYAYGDNGLHLRDAGPEDPTGDTQLGFCSREATAAYCAGDDTQPQLVLRFSE
jgi:hypothetical protein